jgi:hypothetical protein
MLIQNVELPPHPCALKQVPENCGSAGLPCGARDIKVEAWVMGISACKTLFYGREVSFVFAILILFCWPCIPSQGYCV